MDKRTRELAAYASTLRFEDVPPEAVHECKRKFIDTLGCAIGAFDAEPSRIARAVARRYASEPPARIFGTLEKSSPEHAAFANGVMLRYADYNDAYYAKSSGHPSDGLAAVISVGDALHSGGESVITAALLSYEVFCNFSDVLPRELGWDYVVHGVVASAVSSAKLLGLTEQQTAQAISLAVTPNMALEQTRTGELAMWKGCAAANAARNGIFAALLAKEGLTGPDQSIEGRFGMQHAVGRFEWAPFGGRGGPYRVTQTHIKQYPAVVHSQSPITAAIKLHGRARIEDIESIVIDTYWVANRYADRNSPLWRPGTRETADHSIVYLVAAALIDGTITEDSFREERLHDRRIIGLVKKMSIRENPDFTAAHPGKWPCRIEIATHSGGRLVADTDYFRGHCRHPMSDAEVEEKFHRLTAGHLDESAAAAVLKKLWNLEQVRDIGEVVSLLSVKRATL